MHRKAEIVTCSVQERDDLERIARSNTAPLHRTRRANIILKCLDGMPVSQIALEMNIRLNTVIDRRRRFKEERLGALDDRPRSGKPCVYGEDFRRLVLDTLQEPVPEGYVKWDGLLLARHLSVSVHAIWRVIRKQGICLSRKRSWCVSTDPDFSTKAADIVGLYIAPQNVLILVVDEKPSIQALSRTTGYVYMSNKKIARAYKST